MDNENDKLAIVVMSYDGCSDLWDGFFESFSRFWGDCKYPVYLISNELDYAPPSSNIDFRLIKTHDKVIWAPSMREALKSVEEGYVLFLFEDYYLLDNVNTQKFDEAFEFMKKNAFVSMGIYGKNRYKHLAKSKYSTKYKTLNYDDPYCITCGFHILKKDVMIALCKDNYSPWDFENYNSFEALESKKMPCDGQFVDLLDNYYPTFPEGMLVKGQWTRYAYKLCKRLKIEANTKKHSVMSRRTYFRVCVKTFISRLIPPKVKAKLKLKIQGKGRNNQH